MKASTFKDRVKLYVSSGNGGNGCVSFRREKFVPRGGPDGGDGGRGGHVILKADKNVDSLLPLYYQPHQKADKGGNGLGKDCHGRNAQDLYVKVPCGTIVTNQETEERIGELTEHDQEMMICRGGKGGLGNARFATSSHQTPYESTPGEKGQSLTLQLELKIMADVGLVGYPNAGKSTLLSGLSHAHPKIAAYPFTTLNPIIGTVILEGYHYLRIADIPGLIDGAHEGVGLGHDFLRHIERTRFLIFVIDMAGTDGRDPAHDYLNLRRELRLYKRELDTLPYLVVGNKMDKPEAQEYLPIFKERTGEDPICISAMEKAGLDTIIHRLDQQFRDS